ncbi:MAG TPA: type II toxin-antitoxin system RelE/ParE family toxin [Kofleriaceae bacterium]|jgi:plasmid stabilization system protein ParE|nr:type II toxin-antitoxin system RelE/ParE family toxin [Kofleriaceae bacterium]
MSYEVRWMAGARRQAAASQRWWVANRQSAPTMLRDELARVIGLLQNNPELGIGIKGRQIRRVLLPDTEHLLYYRVRPRAQRVEIIALWGAAREFGPSLPLR